MDAFQVQSRTFATPRTVVLEASTDLIVDLDLNTSDGEHFDTTENVISIEVTSETVTLVTVRSIKAWRAGVPNAGRGTFVVPRSSVAQFWMDPEPAIEFRITYPDGQITLASVRAEAVAAWREAAEAETPGVRIDEI